MHPGTSYISASANFIKEDGSTLTQGSGSVEVAQASIKEAYYLDWQDVRKSTFIEFYKCKLIIKSVNMTDEMIDIDFGEGEFRIGHQEQSLAESIIKDLSITADEIEIEIEFLDSQLNENIDKKVEISAIIKPQNEEIPEFEVSLLTIDEDKYVKAIKSEKIIYTCNCGWIDTTHAFTDTSRTELGIGVGSLWNQIVNETGIKSKWKDGYRVVYTQDAHLLTVPGINQPIRPGRTGEYFVKYGLSRDQKKQVALAIFQEITMKFEDFQKVGKVMVWKDHGDASSFEPADLISNMLSFYRTIRPELNKEVLIDRCSKVEIKEALDIYRRHPGTFTDKKYKNKEFSPRFFPNNVCSSPTFPNELQEIQPAEKGGEYFRDWYDLLDIYEGKPPLFGPKY